MNCPRCGQSGPAAAYFCPACGAPRFAQNIEFSAQSTRPAQSEPRFGIDRESNTLWLVHDGKVRYVPQADHIWDVLARSADSAGSHDLGCGEAAWRLEVRYSDGSMVRIDRMFDDSAKAIRCAEDIRQLLAARS